MSRASDAVLAEIEACFSTGAIDETTYVRLKTSIAVPNDRVKLKVPHWSATPEDREGLSSIHVLVRCHSSSTWLLHTVLEDFIHWDYWTKSVYTNYSTFVTQVTNMANWLKKNKVNFTFASWGKWDILVYYDNGDNEFYSTHDIILPVCDETTRDWSRAKTTHNRAKFFLRHLHHPGHPLSFCPIVAVRNLSKGSVEVYLASAYRIAHPEILTEFDMRNLEISHKACFRPIVMSLGCCGDPGQLVFVCSALPFEFIPKNDASMFGFGDLPNNQPYLLPRSRENTWSAVITTKESLRIQLDRAHLPRYHPILGKLSCLKTTEFGLQSIPLAPEYTAHVTDVEPKLVHNKTPELDVAPLIPRGPPLVPLDEVFVVIGTREGGRLVTHHPVVPFFYACNVMLPHWGDIWLCFAKQMTIWVTDRPNVWAKECSMIVDNERGADLVIYGTTQLPIGFDGGVFRYAGVDKTTERIDPWWSEKVGRTECPCRTSARYVFKNAEAVTTEDDADASEVVASSTEDDAGASEVVASTAEDDAGASEVVAGATEENTDASEVAAGATEENTDASEVVASTAEDDAGASEVAAGATEENTDASEVVASTAEDDAGASEVVAGATETVTEVPLSDEDFVHVDERILQAMLHACKELRGQGKKAPSLTSPTFWKQLFQSS